MSRLIKLPGDHQLITTNPKLEGTTVLDFWQWGFSNLLSNVTRGVYAEWLIARILGYDGEPRNPWAGWDLQSNSGVKIEVKSSSYLQDWAKCEFKRLGKVPEQCQVKQSYIVFGGLRSKLWVEETDEFMETDYNADLYVFCLQTETCCQRWNALDMSQWRFYMLTREQLMVNKYASVSLGYVKKRSADYTADEFCEALPAKIQEIAANRSNNILL